MSEAKDLVKRAKRFAKEFDTPAPENNREAAMLIAGVEIGRCQMRKSVLWGILVDTGPIEDQLAKMDRA